MIVIVSWLFREFRISISHAIDLRGEAAMQWSRWACTMRLKPMAENIMIKTINSLSEGQRSSMTCFYCWSRSRSRSHWSTSTKRLSNSHGVNWTSANYTSEQPLLRGSVPPRSRSIATEYCRVGSTSMKRMSRTANLLYSFTLTSEPADHEKSKSARWLPVFLGVAKTYRDTHRIPWQYCNTTPAPRMDTRPVIDLRSMRHYEQELS